MVINGICCVSDKTNKGGTLMKYMTFNRSCSYAGIANLLEEHDIHYEDYEIAKALSLPYLFHYRPQESRYVAGPMIQSYPWFNYFLNSLGFDLIEEWFNIEGVMANLDENNQCYMFSLKINPHSNLRHAVLFEGKENESYRFLNMKRKDSIEPDYYLFNREEVIEKLIPSVIMGYLVKIRKPIPFELSDQLKSSLQHLDNYQVLLNDFCSKEQDVTSLAEARDTLFAPLMLDVLSMMEMVGEAELVNDIKNIRANYMNLMKENRSLVLAEELPLEDLNHIISRYRNILETYSHTYDEKVNLKRELT